MNNIVICGAGGFGREVAWLIENINMAKPIWNLLGFIDNNLQLKGSIIDGYSILGDDTWFDNAHDNIYTVCAVGNSKAKKNWIEKLIQNKNVKFATLIDPNAIFSKRIEIGEGTIICAGTIATVDIKVGKHVIVNLDCTIGHDAIIDDYCTVYPSVNVSGNVSIYPETEIGTGANIIQGIKIGTNTIIGAGSVVTKDIPSYCTAVGIPAKPIKYRKEV